VVGALLSPPSMRAVRWTLLLALVASARAYSSGAPRSACDTLRPSHGPGDTTLSGARAPYVLKAPRAARPGEKLTVSLGGASFKGFMVRALDGAGNSVGRFVAEPSDSWQAMTCQRSGDTATHQRGPPYSQLRLLWEAPSKPGTYRLIATVVEEYTKIYTGYYADVKVSTGHSSSEEVGGNSAPQHHHQSAPPRANHESRAPTSGGGVLSGAGSAFRQNSLGEQTNRGIHLSGNNNRQNHGSFVGNRYSTSYRHEPHPRLPISPHHYNPSSNPFQPQSPHFRRISHGHSDRAFNGRKPPSRFEQGHSSHHSVPQQPFRGHFSRA